MSTEMPEDSGYCTGGSCGCRIDVFPTNRECPGCGKRLRLAGRAQTLELRLNCQHCGYNSPRLSQEEIGELL
jgi:ribosomal protein S27AE